MNMATVVNLWNEDKTRCKISSLLWARLLLAHSRLVYADGVAEQYEPATLVCMERERLGQTGETFDGVTLTLEGKDMRKRIYAYHRDDGKDYGHPGPMKLEAIDAKEWDEKYRELQVLMNRKMKEAIA